VIWDCFTFFNELDLLELRLRELEGTVDRHVIVEATRTFSGLAKPLHYLANKARFARWHDKIVHIIVEDDEASWTAQQRERHHRNSIARGLAGLEPADSVFITDADELPNAEHVLSLWSPDMTCVPWSLCMRQYRYAFNYRYRWDIHWPRMVQGRWLLGGGTPDDARWSVITQDHIVPDAGWHFSYMGGKNAIDAKLSATAHHDHPDMGVTRKRFATQQPPYNDGAVRQVVIDSTYPKAVWQQEAAWRQKGYIL
jgi:hypothetical protein